MAALKKIVGVVVLLMSGIMTFAQNYLEFVENKGQWDKKIRFLANTGIGSVALQSDGYRVLLYNESDLSRLNPHAGTHQHNTPTPTVKTSSNVDIPRNPEGGGGTSENGILRGHTYQVKFLNANPNAEVVPDKALSAYNNYFIGNDSTKWAPNCKIYQAVTFKNIYPNIDIRYYTTSGVLKYDLIVHPGGNIDDVNLYFEGADGLKVKDKKLLIKTSVMDVQEMEPYSYQLLRNTKKEVPCSFDVKGNIVRFKLNGAYNKDATLVIDPSIVFISYSGSTADNWGFTATYDAQGNFYGGGIVFQSGTFPVNNGAFQRTFQGGVREGDLPANDIAIIKFDPSGFNRIYATYLGGTGNEQPHSLVVDGQGNLFIAGRSSSGNTYPTRGLGLYGSGGGADIIITKLNASGSDILSSIRIGGTGDEGVNVRQNYTPPFVAESTRRNYGDDARSEIILDAAGNPILASVTQSVNFPITASAFQTTPGTATPTRFQDGVVIKLNADLSAVQFSSFLGGNGDDAAFVLALHPQNGNIYVAGGTMSNNLPGDKSGVLFPTFQGNVDGFVSIISPDGSQILKTSYFATNGIDLIYGIQFDRNGFPYIMGTTTVAWPVINAPINANNSQATGKQFISKLQPDLSGFIYSTNFGTVTGSVPNISPTAFLVDRCENVYVSGWGGTLQTGMPSSGTRGLVTAGTDQFKTSTDGEDLYFYVIEKDARSILFASFFGASALNATNPPSPDHVDGGTSRFDRNGTIYQSICSCSGNSDGSGMVTGTAGAWARNNQNQSNGGRCNLLAIKLSFDLAGVGAGIQTSINGVPRDTAGCVPLTVDFRDTIAQAKAYWWNFGDGTPDIRTTTPSISHTFNNIGLYRVRLIAVDSSKCNLADTVYINMRVRGDEAALSFTATKVPPCESLTFEFNNTSVAPAGKPFTNQSFRWDFGDGTTRIAGTGIVTHTYAAGGTFDVKLVLIDTNYCNHADSIIQQIRISPNVDARFTTPAIGCAPYNAVFNNTSLAGQQFFWDFGDGSTSTATSPTHLYATPGSYTVQLIAVDNATCNLRDTTTQTITVSGSPTAAFTYSPNPTEPNTPVVFNNGSVGGTSFKWLFGDGDSTITTDPDIQVPHQYNRTGTYNACLIAFNAAGCSDTTCQSISVTVNANAEVPNAFSPNGDGTNDRIFVRGFGIGKMTWRIYNRWGVQVYISNNQTEGWDGTYKGRLQPQDVYHYTLQIEFTSGDKVSRKGDITLLR
nr:PKD domain-containing protein [uncultured Sediminibacterium sp.]